MNSKTLERQQKGRLPAIYICEYTQKETMEYIKYIIHILFLTCSFFLYFYGKFYLVFALLLLFIYVFKKKFSKSLK